MYQSGIGKAPKYFNAFDAEEPTKLYTGWMISTVFVTFGPIIDSCGEFCATDSPLRA